MKIPRKLLSLIGGIGIIASSANGIERSIGQLLDMEIAMPPSESKLQTNFIRVIYKETRHNKVYDKIKAYHFDNKTIYFIPLFEGDTLNKIAEILKDDNGGYLHRSVDYIVDEIAKENNIKDKNKIYAGTTLKYTVHVIPHTDPIISNDYKEKSQEEAIINLMIYGHLI